MNEGNWVRLYRMIIDSQVFANAELLRVWIWCLCKATWKKKHISMKTGTGETIITLNPGQFIYGRDSSARELISKPETLRGQIKKLVEMGNISVLATRHYSIVSVSNWQSYQTRRKRNSQPDTNQTPTRHHKQEGQEGQEGQDYKSPAPPRGELTPEEIQENKAPTLEEVIEFCRMRVEAGAPKIDAARFHSQNSSRGWVDKNGKPMRNWKSFVFAWEKNADKYDNQPF